MTIQWTPEVEEAYLAQVRTVDPTLIDNAVTAVCNAAEKACGNRFAHADFPLRFVVAAVLEHAGFTDQRHLIELREDGWTLQHPLSCRPNLFECDLNAAAGPLEAPTELGVFACWLEDGRLAVGEREPEPV